MASGMGLLGNVGRCFSAFEEFSVCMKGSDEPIKKCVGLKDDYLECLHNKKADLREKQIAAQKVENEKIAKQEGAGGGSGGHKH